MLSGIAGVNLLPYANVLLLRAKARAGTTMFRVWRQAPLEPAQTHRVEAQSPGRGGQIGIDRAAEGASSAGALRSLLFGRIIAERGSAQDSEAVASNCQLKPRS